MGKGRCGLSDEPAGRTEERGVRPWDQCYRATGWWGGGVAAPGRAECLCTVLRQHQGQGSGTAVVPKAKPVIAFSHCSKLALEYGWGYFMIIYKSFSDDMNPLMRWSCDKIPCKAINFSADVFLEGGKKLFSRKVSCGWLNFKFIFCSSAERVKIKSLVLLTIAPILLY